MKTPELASSGVGTTGKNHGGEGGIRTLDRGLRPYSGLANRRPQPLGDFSIKDEDYFSSKRLNAVYPNASAPFKLIILLLDIKYFSNSKGQEF